MSENPPLPSHITENQTVLLFAHQNLSGWQTKLMQETVTPAQVNLVLFGALRDIIRVLGWKDQEQFFADEMAFLEHVYGKDEPDE